MPSQAERDAITARVASGGGARTGIALILLGGLLAGVGFSAVTSSGVVAFLAVTGGGFAVFGAVLAAGSMIVERYVGHEPERG